MGDPRAVLITGCSTGIGRATAEHMSRRGWAVYATARRPETIADLEARGCRVLALDVTDESSMLEAVAAVEREHDAVGALVNNAGYGLEGAAETTPMDEVRRQFETNVFGLIRMCQIVLPAMRATRRGTIVNVSSVGGKITLPGGAYYHASKHAVEAFSDVLRYEVAPFGIDVVVIEPGLIRTAFAATATKDMAAGEAGPYESFNRAVADTVTGAYEGVMARISGAAGPEAVAKVIGTACSARRPRTRYRVTSGARVALAARKALPDRAWALLLRTRYPRPDAGP